MPINPCGFACDVGRKPYTVRVRPFADSAEEVEIRWYAVPWGTPFLPFESAFVSQAWDDEPWARTGVGEVFTPQLKFNTWRRPPMPDQPHICGTPEEFANGVTYDPDRDVQYTTQGLPTCCAGAGGVVIGGDGAFVVAGGVVIGGAAEAATLGGLLLGGEFEYQPTPGTSCANAGILFLGWEAFGPMPIIAPEWWAIDLVAGNYRLEITGWASLFGTIVDGFIGTCPTPLTSVGLTLGSGTFCWNFTIASDQRVWFQIQSAVTSPNPYTIAVRSGPCPP